MLQFDEELVVGQEEVLIGKIDAAVDHEARSGEIVFQFARGRVPHEDSVVGDAADFAARGTERHGGPLETARRILRSDQFLLFDVEKIHGVVAGEGDPFSVGAQGRDRAFRSPEMTDRLPSGEVPDGQFSAAAARGESFGVEELGPQNVLFRAPIALVRSPDEGWTIFLPSIVQISSRF